jgi:ATP-binding cassette subfamily B (MDR/TAP) protein 1
MGFLNEKLKKPEALIPNKGHTAGVSFGFAQFTIFGIYALIFYIGALLHRDDGLTMKDMLASIFPIIFASMRAGMNLHYAGDIGDAHNAAVSIFEILDTPDEVQLQLKNREKHVHPEKVRGDIEFKDVVFKYPSRDKIVLKKLNLKINAGEKTAFVGPSGCGKSTIMQLLLRYYDVVSGEIFLDGVNILDYDITYLRGYFGVVQQEPTVF